MLQISWSSQTDTPDKVPLLKASDIVRYYWVVECQKDGNSNWHVAIGVNQKDIEPQYHYSGSRIFVGVEQGVFVLNLENGAVVNQISDVSFVQWFEGAPEKRVLLAAEDQVLAFDEQGTLLWRQNLPDIIEDIETDNNCVRITDVSGEIYLHDLKTGKIFQ